ncbi:MAG: hypothetical protein ABSD20_09325 [Terriglobales bacterium]|jgi:hypothetical protein
MIFGFNTDLTHDGTVYHVQSELRQARDGDRLVTQVFVRGQCIGTRGAEVSELDKAGEQQLQDTLKSQHRQALASITEGRLEDFLMADK